MAAVELLDRDVDLYQDHLRGMRKIQLAEKYGIHRETVGTILAKVKAQMPQRDRGELFDQSVEILDQGLEVFVPMMLQGDKGAGRLVDRFLGRRAVFLGLDSPAKLELSQAKDQVQTERIDVRAELKAIIAEIQGRTDAP